MKVKIVITGIAVLLLLVTGPLKADEQTDLTQKIDALEKTIDDLNGKVVEMEKAQEKQKKDIDRMKKEPSAYEVVSDTLGKSTKIGGHLKLYLMDYADGERNDVDQNNNLAAGFSELWLLFGKAINDWLNVEVTPNIRVAAGATPSLGDDIRRTGTASVDIDIDEAYMSLRLPYGLEMRAGAFYPYFSDDYAGRVWWHEMLHGSNGLITLENWQTTGIELYRNFDFELFSLPVYIYPYLNGLSRGRSNDTRFTDNNSDKHVLAHVAPETFFMGARFRLLASLGWGKWDDDGDNNSWQTAAGLDVTYRGVKVSGEYMLKKREDWPLASGVTHDADDKGWYMRLFYTLTSKWRFLLKYSDVDLFYPSDNRMLTDNYKTMEAAINYWISEGSTIIPQVEYVDADRSDDSETLEYFRYMIGWRTTF